MRANSKVFFALLAVLLLGGCGGDSTGVGGDVTGTYTLRTIAGQPLPYTFPNQSPSNVTTINSGNIIVNSGGSFSESVTSTTVTPGATNTSTITCVGTYTTSGTTIFFNEPTQSNQACGGPFSGAWDGNNTVTINIDVGVNAVFTK